MNDTDNLWGAMLRVRAKLKAIPKTATNPHFGNKYAPLGAVLAEVVPACEAEGLVLSGGGVYTTGGWALEQRVTHVDSGEFHAIMVPLVGITDMQKVGGAFTYGGRYGIGALFSLELEDDDDGNKAASGGSQSRGAVAPQGGAQGSAPYRRSPLEGIENKPLSPYPPGEGPRSTTVKSGSGKGRPAPKAQDDDADAVVFMAEQLDMKAEQDGKDFRIVKADGKLGIFGKIAERGGVPPGVYSTAQLAAKGALPKIRGFYQYLCEQNDLAVWGNASTSGVAKHEAPADVASLTDDEMPF